MTEAERDALLADLRRKLEKRRDEPGFAANVSELEAKIAELEAMVFEQPVEPVPEPVEEAAPEPEIELGDE